MESTNPPMWKLTLYHTEHSPSSCFQQQGFWKRPQWPRRKSCPQPWLTSTSSMDSSGAHKFENSCCESNRHGEGIIASWKGSYHPQLISGPLSWSCLWRRVLLGGPEASAVLPQSGELWYWWKASIWKVKESWAIDNPIRDPVPWENTSFGTAISSDSLPGFQWRPLPEDRAPDERNSKGKFYFPLCI